MSNVPTSRKVLKWFGTALVRSDQSFTRLGDLAIYCRLLERLLRVSHVESANTTEVADTRNPQKPDAQHPGKILNGDRCSQPRKLSQSG